MVMLKDFKNNINNNDKEVNEAIDAANYALDCLNNAKRHLNDARSWGMLDIMGGGLFTTAIKHSKMNNAQDYIAEAKRALKKFEKELEDVGEELNLDYNISDFISFADYFFDGFMADMFAQKRINDARRQLDEVINKVKNIKNKLERIY